MATAHQIRFCLDKAREMTAQYNLGVFPAGNTSLKSLDDFIGLCEDNLDIDIEKLDVIIPEPDGSTIKAAFIAFKDHYGIYAAKGLQINWRRFVVCKELFQALLDKDECRNLNIWGHLQNFLSPAPGDDQPESVTWEMLAGIAAVEFLFPYSDRVIILEQCKRKGEKVDSVKLEAQYGLPAPVIEAYLSESAMSYFYSFREDGAKN